MGSANHRMCSVTTYPFNVFGGAWAESTPPHLSQLPFKGDTVVGSDVWLGRECTVMPGAVSYTHLDVYKRQTTACTRQPNRFFSARFIFLSGIRIRLPFAFLPILSVGQPTDFFRFQDSTCRMECQCTVCTGNVNFL